MAAANNPVLREKLRLKGTLEAQLMSRRGQQQQPAGPTPTEEALREARAQLARMRSQLTEQHPDMLGLRARIRDLEQQSLREKRQRTAPGEDPEERALSAQIAELDAEITRLTQISAPRPRPVEEGTAETPRAPATPDPARLETEYNQLYKDREIAKARYEELEAQRKQTESWAAAITERAPLQFRVIDPAFLPVRPIKPSRRKMAMAGLALGLLFGIGAALGRVILDPRIYDEDDLRRASGLLVFASIPGSDRKEA
jgi:uncharacterized protein involved in exopolysaccharide biosynthesis